MLNPKNVSKKCKNAEKIFCVGYTKFYEKVDFFSKRVKTIFFILTEIS